MQPETQFGTSHTDSPLRQGFSRPQSGTHCDDGIDIVLDARLVRVQVQRDRGKIPVAQIGEFTGAVVINGPTPGIFVTMSNFQSGAARTACLSDQADGQSS
jgi:restriction endonuclease Mrr